VEKLPLTLFNDLYKEKQIFNPIEDNIVKIYVCGPTVYDSPHIGHARSAIAFDTLRRYLLFKKYKVIYVSNYTDVDDKMIDRANELGISISELAEKYIKEYEEVMAKLNVIPPDFKPRATQTIDDMIKFISKIIENGYAYVSNGSVYFDVQKYNEYHSLFMRKTLEKKINSENDATDGEESIITQSSIDQSILEEKRSEYDFALWKKAKPNESSWDSPWGKGRPGWHIECSTMAYKLLGKEIDIHGGGRDLIFPHHTNEIAQTYAAFGTKLARFWVHNGFVNINNEKMSKSLKNFFTVKEVLEEFDGNSIRFFLNSLKYRNPINYSVESIKEAKKNLQKIIDFYNTIKYLKTSALKNTETAEEEIQTGISNLDNLNNLNNKIDEYYNKFIMALDNDLNTTDALGEIYQLIRCVNSYIFEKKNKIDEKTKNKILKFVIDFGNIFGLIIDKQKQQLQGFGILGSSEQDKMNLTLESNLQSIIDSKDNMISSLVDLILDIRNELRRRKNYELSDKIRDSLNELGIIVNDSKNESIWKFKEDKAD